MSALQEERASSVLAAPDSVNGIVEDSQIPEESRYATALAQAEYVTQVRLLILPATHHAVAEAHACSSCSSRSTCARDIFQMKC
jgi:hypothetical protein